MKPNLKVTKDFTQDLKQIVKRFRNDSVRVGIPAEESKREGAKINNAALLAIHHFGSPANNIPARPVLSIGIRLAQEEIAEQFKIATQKALSQGFRAVRDAYERIGIIASNSVKKVINSQIEIEGPADSTIASRKARGFSGTKALIVTGQLRNAITYVVKEG
jgi:hypothetical protein